MIPLVWWSGVTTVGGGLSATDGFFSGIVTAFCR